MGKEFLPAIYREYHTNARNVQKPKADHLTHDHLQIAITEARIGSDGQHASGVAGAACSSRPAIL